MDMYGQNVHYATSSSVNQDNQTDMKLFYFVSSNPTDVAFIVEGKEIYTYRKLLCEASPVFKTMLESDHFVEKNKDKIELPGKSFNDIQEMLKVLYSIDYKITKNTNIDGLLNLSREYQMKKVKSMCEDYLLKRPCSIDLLIKAQEYDLAGLLVKCLDFFGGKPLVSLKEHPRFAEISKENLSFIKDRQFEELQLFLEKLWKKTSQNHVSSANRWMRHDQYQPTVVDYIRTKYQEFSSSNCQNTKPMPNRPTIMRKDCLSSNPQEEDWDWEN